MRTVVACAIALALLVSSAMADGPFSFSGGLDWRGLVGSPVDVFSSKPIAGSGIHECGGFGTLTIETMEKLATEMNREGQVPCPKTGCGPEPDSPKNFELLLQERLEELRQKHGDNRPDLFARPKEPSNEVLKRCLPNLWKYNERIAARQNEAESRRANARSLVKQLQDAYYNYSIVQQCHQDSSSLFVIGDAELDRAQMMAKAIAANCHRIGDTTEAAKMVT